MKPLFNNVLVELEDKYSGVIRNDENETMQKGKLIDFNVIDLHLTTSTGLIIPKESVLAIENVLNMWRGKTIYWQQHADIGQTFDQDGKKYSLVPWYRLIGVWEEKENK